MGVEDKHLLFPMPLLKSQFDAIHTGRADPSRYLIIGFDTEYQRFADESTHTLNNEVLSYQYCCTVVERDGDDNAAPIWSGLFQPKSSKVEDRLSLEEFLVAAVTDGCKRFPDLKLPSTIYLVAHFTRADVPGFADFKDEATKSALQLDNIRNLFMNESTIFPLEKAYTSCSTSSRFMEIYYEHKTSHDGVDWRHGCSRSSFAC